MFFKSFQKLSLLSRLSILIVVVLSAGLGLSYGYKKRGNIVSYLYPEYRNDKAITLSDKDIEMAKKVMNGGYIIHFRHAERDKWIDVQMYDALESDVHNNGLNDSRYAEKDYFKDAVCLNERGMIQARAMGEHLKNIKFPVGYIISSPSCRARQTAEIVFQKYDKLDRDLVHDGPYYEIKSTRIKKLTNLYKNLPIFEGKNTIVSAHNGVIRSQMFENSKAPYLSLEEGGFYIISRKDDKLYLEHEFHNFNTFIRNFYERK